MSKFFDPLLNPGQEFNFEQRIEAEEQEQVQQPQKQQQTVTKPPPPSVPRPTATTTTAATTTATSSSSNLFGDTQDVFSAPFVAGAKKESASSAAPHRTSDAIIASMTMAASASSSSASASADDEATDLFGSSADEVSTDANLSAPELLVSPPKNKAIKTINLLRPANESESLLEDRNLDGLFLPDEAVEKTTTKKQATLDADLFSVDDDDFAKFQESQAKASAVEAASKSVAQVTAAASTDFLSSVLDDVTLDENDSSVTDGFDFASYIKQQQSSSSSKSGASLFD